MVNRWETMERIIDFIIFGSKITADCDCSCEIKRWWILERKAMTILGSILKSRYYFAYRGLSTQRYGFSSSHVWMWELEYKKSWVPKSWCFWTVVLEKTLESPLGFKEIQVVHPNGNQSWIFFGWTDAEADSSRLGHCMQRMYSLEEALMLGKIEGSRTVLPPCWLRW